MAERKPLFMDTAGWHEEMDPTDSASFGGLALSGDITMAGNLITGLGPATTAGDAVSYGQGGPVLLSGLDLGGNKLENLAIGTVDTDAVNKGQLDSAIQGLDVQPSCRVTSTTNQGTYSASGGAGGNGQITGATTTIDGVALAEGDRVLVQGQTDAKQNGIYVVTATTSTWDRALDFDEDDEVTANAFTFVSEGDVWADTGWTLATNDPITLNTHDLDWVQFSAAGVISAGDGLYKVGQVVHVGAGLGIDVNADDIEVQLAATNPALEFTVNSGLQVQVVSSGGLFRQSDGLLIKLDETPDTLDVDTDGLKVVGLPSNFKINGSAVGNDVTTANLDTLTDGSDAVGLHTHDSEYSPLGHNHDGDYSPIGHTHAHSELTGVGEDDHHNRLHEVTSSGDHFVSGETPGHVLTITGTGDTFAWTQAPSASEAERVETDCAVSEAIAVGDPVYWSTTDDQVAKADSGVDAKAYVFGIATTAQSTVGLTCSVVSIGEAAGVLTGLGATAGDNVYLADGGGLTLTPQNGKRVIRVGIAMNADDLWVEIQDYGKRAA